MWDVVAGARHSILETCPERSPPSAWLRTSGSWRAPDSISRPSSPRPWSRSAGRCPGSPRAWPPRTPAPSCSPAPASSARCRASTTTTGSSASSSTAPRSPPPSPRSPARRCPSAGVHAFHDGEVERSQRMRTFMRPRFDFGDEARVVFRDGDAELGRHVAVPWCRRPPVHRGRDRRSWARSRSSWPSGCAPACWPGSPTPRRRAETGGTAVLVVGSDNRLVQVSAGCRGADRRPDRDGGDLRRPAGRRGCPGGCGAPLRPGGEPRRRRGHGCAGRAACGWCSRPRR